MAKKSGTLSAIHMQTAAASAAATGIGLSRIGTTFWYAVADAANYFWDRAKAIVIYDDATPVVPLEIDYVAGAVRLSAAAGGAVTADVYKFLCTQVGGFKSHTIDEGIALVECGCYEDVGEQYEATVYNASGSAEGFYTTVDAKLTMALGSNKDLEFTSLVLGHGPAHDGVSAASIEIAVAGNNTALSVVVTGSAIVINSATGAGGAATSTARAIRDALEASAAAMALIKVRLATGSDGSGIPGAVAHAHLTGGIDPAAFDTLGQDLVAVFYWDSGASLIRTVGVIILEKVSLKTGIKDLVGRTISFKFQGMAYDHQG
jgi:hypothetical protein